MKRYKGNKTHYTSSQIQYNLAICNNFSPLMTNVVNNFKCSQGEFCNKVNTYVDLTTSTYDYNIKLEDRWMHYKSSLIAKSVSDFIFRFQKKKFLYKIFKSY